MNNRFLKGIVEFFGPDMPRWACELTSRHVIVVGTSPDRRHAVSQVAIPLPVGALAGDLKRANVLDRTAVQDALQRALSTAGFSGSELALVIPDDAVRITLLNVDSLPPVHAERQEIIRWKLRKNVPFDVESAQLAYQKLRENGTVELLVALTPRAVAEEYEKMMESMGLHAGIVNPSTPAALNLVDSSDADVLFVKVGPQSVTTSILVDGRLRFYRKVPSQPLYDAIYPTFMYYQDKLERGQLRDLVLCGRNAESEEEREVAEKLSVPIRRLHSSELDDLYKPALGALQL